MNFDDLDAKMRVYEQSLDQVLLPELYLVARLDGNRLFDWDINDKSVVLPIVLRVYGYQTNKYIPVDHKILLLYDVYGSLNAVQPDEGGLIEFR